VSEPGSNAMFGFGKAVLTRLTRALRVSVVFSGGCFLPPSASVVSITDVQRLPSARLVCLSVLAVLATFLLPTLNTETSFSDRGLIRAPAYRECLGP